MKHKTKRTGVSVTTKALLGILNNCKPINTRENRINYTGKTLILESKTTATQPKMKKPTKIPKRSNSSQGIPIKEILTFVYGRPDKYPEKSHPIALRSNLNRRLKTLVKKKIIKKVGSGKYSYILNNNLSTFKKIVRLLSKEKQIWQLVYTEYFKKDGIEHFNALFEKRPEFYLDVNRSDPDQLSRFEEYTYGRLMKSPTFLNILVSDSLPERLKTLQESLYASYLRQQSVKNNFPFVQLLGTYCAIIDYLNGEADFDSNSLTECFNDTDRLIYAHSENNKKEAFAKLRKVVNRMKKPVPIQKMSKKPKRLTKKNSSYAPALDSPEMRNELDRLNDTGAPQESDALDLKYKCGEQDSNLRKH